MSIPHLGSFTSSAVDTAEKLVSVSGSMLEEGGTRYNVVHRHEVGDVNV